jgi:hypothetical protein
MDIYNKSQRLATFVVCFFLFFMVAQAALRQEGTAASDGESGDAAASGNREAVASGRGGGAVGANGTTCGEAAAPGAEAAAPGRETLALGVGVIMRRRVTGSTNCVDFGKTKVCPGPLKSSLRIFFTAAKRVGFIFGCGASNGVKIFHPRHKNNTG